MSLRKIIKDALRFALGSINWNGWSSCKHYKLTEGLETYSEWHELAGRWWW